MKKINIKTQNKLDVNFSMSSMTDIIFLLLIFFMITASFENLEGIDINLPKSSNAEEILDPISILVNKNGDIILDENTYTLKELEHILSNKIMQFKGTPKILIEADKSIAIDRIVQISNVIKSISYNSTISIATKQ